MKRFYPFLFDVFVLSGIVLLFQTYTNQKNFKIDIIGLGLFSLFSYSAFHFKKFKNEPKQFLILLQVILLTCFVFLKIAEYDPIQIFPQKLGIKLVTFTWILFILFTFHKIPEEYFANIGPFLAIVPVLSFINFMAYPAVPLSLALIIVSRNLKIQYEKDSYIPIVFIFLFLCIFARDWWDDFGLQRAILLFEAILFFKVIQCWNRKELEFFLKTCIFFFVINSLFIFWGLSLDPKFQIASYHEDIYLVPVSLLASNSLLIIMISVIFWFEPNHNFIDKLFLAIASFTSIIWFGITVSRNSIVSLLIFLLIAFYLRQSESKKKKLFYVFIVIISIIGFSFLFFTEKSIFNLGSSAVRVSIWGFYILNTLNTHPFFGFGLYPENKIPFATSSEIKTESLHYIKDYISNFQSFPLAHNLYVQFFGSFGIIGMFLIILLLLIFLYSRKEKFLAHIKSHLLISGIILVWLLHELYDFNSLEISNLYLLVGILSIFRIPEVSGKFPEYNLSNQMKSVFVILISIILIIVTFRFAYVDHFTLKYARRVVPHNFEYYLPRISNTNIDESPLPEFSGLEYSFFGNKFFFYNFAGQKDFNSKVRHLEYCFELQKYPAICYSKLLGFQKEEDYFSHLKPTFQYFLHLYDPFDIYKREPL